MTLLVVLHMVLAVFIIGIVLLQDFKGGSGGLFGGGGSQAVFGASGGTTFLVKITKWLVILFAASSLWLTYLTNNKGGKSVFEKGGATQTTPPPIKK